MKHQELVKITLLEISKMYPKFRVWEQIVGVARSLDGNRIIKYGLKGQADITGIIPPNGRRLEIEVKVGKDKQSEDQKNFEAMIKSSNGIYLIITDKLPVQEQILCLQNC